jgi:hypothetical protein
MRIRDAFPVRLLQASSALIPFLVCAAWLSVPAEAQHGGGGHGGFGGGHFGGGHSHTGGHAHSSDAGHAGGGHFHWMKFGLGKHSARVSDSASDASEDPNRWSSSLWNFNTPGYAGYSHRLPSTMLWTPRRIEAGLGSGMIKYSSAKRLSFSSSPTHFRHGRYSRRYRFLGASGCFFNGATQVCYFEPFLSLLCFGDFGYGGDFGFGSDSDWDSTAIEPEEMAETAPAAPGYDENPPPESSANSDVSLERRLGATEDWDLGKDVYVLVLRDGTTHVVTNYWVAEGYLEYVSPDEVRSHIPLSAFDLEGTVERNQSRGIRFVLRAAPGG